MLCIEVTIASEAHRMGYLGIQEAGIKAAVSVEELGLRPQDVWVYVIPAKVYVPAVMVRITALYKKERSRVVLQKLAKSVGDAICGCFRPECGVAVFTLELQDEDRGFYEVLPK
ncbi:MAG TPA: hypothetical protein VJJ22_03815 [Candidatus Paceibacterota bacterium]